eukprot:COSAG03_NODE_4962_length_1378_cov_7.369820_2_plen_225_part_00
MPGLWRAGACKHLIVSIPTAPLIPPQAADDALPPLSHPCACAACRSTRLRRGSAVRSCPPAARCLGAAARRPRGGDGGDERRRGGRLFEAIENDTLVVTEMLAEGYWWFSPPSCCFNLIRWTPLTLGSSAFCCVRAGEEGDVPESRRHGYGVAWWCLRRAGSWASSLIATRSAGGGRPLSTGGITTFLSPASSSSHILSIILLCICSLAKQVGATFRLEACGWF